MEHSSILRHKDNYSQVLLSKMTVNLDTRWAKTMLHRSNLVYFYTAHKLKMVFTLSNGLKKILKYFRTHENYIKFKFGVKKISSEHSHTHMVTYCLWLLLHDNSIVEWPERKTIWTRKPKILSIGPMKNSLTTPDQKNS